MFTKMRLPICVSLTSVLRASVFFLIANCLSSDRISDKRLCADRECKTLISKAKALATHKHADPAFLSFHRGQHIMIYSKSAGTREDLWGGEVNGKSGYFPRSFVRELKADVPNPQYEVETEPHVPLKDRVLGRTSPPPPQKTVKEPEQVKVDIDGVEKGREPEQKQLQTEQEPEQVKVDIDGVEKGREPEQKQLQTEQEPEPKKVEDNSNKDKTATADETEKDETDLEEDETELGDDETELGDTEAENKQDTTEEIEQKAHTNSEESAAAAATDSSRAEIEETEVDETDIEEDDEESEEDDTDLEEDTDLDDTEEDDGISETSNQDDQEVQDYTIKPDEAEQSSQDSSAHAGMVEGQTDNAEDQTDKAEGQADNAEGQADKADSQEDKTEGQGDKVEGQADKTESEGTGIPDKAVDSGEQNSEPGADDETEPSEEVEEEAQGSLFSRMFSEVGEGKVSEEDSIVGDDNVGSVETEHDLDVDEGTKSAEDRGNDNNLEEASDSDNNLLNKILHENLEDKIEDEKQLNQGHITNDEAERGEGILDNDKTNLDSAVIGNDKLKSETSEINRDDRNKPSIEEVSGEKQTVDEDANLKSSEVEISSSLDDLSSNNELKLGNENKQSVLEEKQISQDTEVTVNKDEDLNYNNIPDNDKLDTDLGEQIAEETFASESKLDRESNILSESIESRDKEVLDNNYENVIDNVKKRHKTENPSATIEEVDISYVKDLDKVKAVTDKSMSGEEEQHGTKGGLNLPEKGPVIDGEHVPEVKQTDSAHDKDPALKDLEEDLEDLDVEDEAEEEGAETGSRDLDIEQSADRAAVKNTISGTKEDEESTDGQITEEDLDRTDAVNVSGDSHPEDESKNEGDDKLDSGSVDEEVVNSDSQDKGKMEEQGEILSKQINEDLLQFVGENEDDDSSVNESKDTENAVEDLSKNVKEFDIPKTDSKEKVELDKDSVKLDKEMPIESSVLDGTQSNKVDDKTEIKDATVGIISSATDMSQDETGDVKIAEHTEIQDTATDITPTTADASHDGTDAIKTKESREFQNLAADITPTATNTPQYETDVYETDTQFYESESATDTAFDATSQIQTSFSEASPMYTEQVPSTSNLVKNEETFTTTQEEVDSEEGFVVDGTTFPPGYFDEPAATPVALSSSSPSQPFTGHTGTLSTDQVETSIMEEVLSSVEIKPTSVSQLEISSETSEVSTFEPNSLKTESLVSSSVHILGTSFSYASSEADNTNTAPIESTNSASVETVSSLENITETTEAVKEPSVDDAVYKADNYLSRKPLSTGSPSDYTGASADGMPGQSSGHSTEDVQIGNNLNEASMNKDANYQKDLNIPPAEDNKVDNSNVYQSIPEEVGTDSQKDKTTTENIIKENGGDDILNREEKQKQEYEEQQNKQDVGAGQTVTPPTFENQQGSDDYLAISRKVPDMTLDEDIVKPQTSYLQSLEPTLKYIVYKLPPSVLSILEQEPLGLSPTMAVLVSIVTMNVLFFVSCISCICRGGKKSTKQDPVVIIRGLEEKLFITTKEKENLEDELQIQTKKSQELEQEVDMHQSTSGTVEMDMKTVRLHNEALKKQVLTLQQEVTDYKHEVTEKATDIKQKASTIAEYEKEMKALMSRNEDSDQLIHKTNQSLSEKSDDLRLLQSQVESLTEQMNQQETRKQQLEEESVEWAEKVRELTEQVEQFTQETRRMQEDLAFKENEMEVLRDCFLQVKAFQGEEEMKEEPETADLQEKLKAMMDVSRINASLRAVEEDRDVLQNKLKIEIDSRKDIEDQIQQLRRKMDTCQADKMKAERQGQESQTRLEVLSKYFKEKEAELARQLGEQEVLKNQNLSKLQSSDSLTEDLQKQNESYRQQMEELKTEITKADRDFRSQIAANEKKAHENWLATRAAERELKESRHECGMLRQKLTDLERKLFQGPPGLIRPISHRGMPPPGMMNGPPPPPPPERPGSRGDDDYIGSPMGPDRMPPPPDRRMPPGPRPPLPPMDARSPPPYAIRPPFPPDRRSPPPFDRYPPPPPRGPMGPRGPRPPYPGGLPPPSHLHSSPSRSPPAELDDSRQGQFNRSHPGSRDRGPPPPRHQSQV